MYLHHWWFHYTEKIHGSVDIVQNRKAIGNVINCILYTRGEETVGANVTLKGMAKLRSTVAIYLKPPLSKLKKL